MTLGCRNNRHFYYDNRAQFIATDACPSCGSGRRLCPGTNSIQLLQNKLVRRAVADYYPWLKAPTFNPAIGLGKNFSIQQLATGNVVPRSCPY